MTPKFRAGDRVHFIEELRGPNNTSQEYGTIVRISISRKFFGPKAEPVDPLAFKGANAPNNESKL
ncbi:MAG TPA: hypothetical protein VE242_11640 [Chthoniobacterales bacterium]|jgi:hypothetical protein|nr:hypothetical protein [Chthoniobacterales bacterium]